MKILKNSICRLFLCFFTKFIIKDVNKMSININNKSIAFLCCARNVSNYIFNNIQNLTRLSQPFKKSYIFIYENDSSDDTLNILQQLKSNFESTNPNNIIFRIYTRKGLDTQIPLRTHRLAYIRNFLKNEAYKIKDELDYVVVTDMDNVTNYVVDKGFFNSLEILNNNDFTDAIFATFYNSKKELHYYDKWALRYKNFDYNCLEGVHYMQILMITLIHNIDRPSMQDYIGESFLHNHPDVNNLIHKLKNNEIVKVQSAFGGMGIYKPNVYFLGEYDGQNKIPFFFVKKLPPLAKAKEDCEHINFHSSISEKLNRQPNFYINPQFVVSEVNL
jgi:hypothetical protein